MTDLARDDSIHPRRGKHCTCIVEGYKCYCFIFLFCSMLRGMEIIQPVADLFVSALSIGALVLSAMFFAVMVQHIVDSMGLDRE